MSLQDIPWGYKINLKKKSINAILTDLIFEYAQNHYQRKAGQKPKQFTSKTRLTKEEKRMQSMNPDLIIQRIWKN